MATRPPVNSVIAIIGTTGTGKSQLAVELALKFNGEVINADAVQMYEGLPIITNKIPLEERRGVLHHLLGCIGLDEPTWRVDKFVKRAGEVLQEIRRRGKLPILVGGTHYYTQSLLFENSLAEEQQDENHISEHESQDISDQYPILKASPQDMLDKLREVDPVMADRWHPRDGRKIRRSLEIYFKTGKKASDVYMEQARRAKKVNGENEHDTSAVENNRAPTGLRYPTLFLWTYTPREILKSRLQHRVDKMVEDGLITEAKGLKAHATERKRLGGETDGTRGVYIAIGYKELLPYIAKLDEQSSSNESMDSLRRDALDAIEKTKTATWQYAKYQERWIRLKLLRAIREANAQNYIRALDTSVADDWAHKISRPSAAVVDAFLTRQQMKSPSDISSAFGKAQIVLQEAFKSLENSSTGITKTRTCEFCGVTATTEKEWEKHIQSNRHRKTVAFKQKAALQDTPNSALDDL